MLRFDKQQHEFYSGIDLHAKPMYGCLANQAGETLVPPIRALASLRDGDITHV